MRGAIGSDRMWRRTAGAVTTAALLTMAACSSGTDDGSGGLAGLATSTTTVGAPGIPGTSGTVGGAAGGPAATVGGTAPSAAPGGNAGGTPTTAAQAPPSNPGGAPVKLGRGVTDSTITLGFTEMGDVGAANRAVGGSSAREGETPRKDYGDPLISWFNRNGGIAGRKIVPVWADVRVTPNQTMAANRQGVCATFTQDNKVFAAQLIATMLYPDVLECLNRAGTIAISDSQQQYTLDDVALRTWPNVYLPFSLSLDRMMRVYADSIIKSGFVDSKLARVGLAYYRTDAATRAVNKVLKPALSARGISIAQEAAFTATESVDTFAQTQAEAQSAVLRFRAAGITHVIFAIANGAFLTGPFTTNAEQQGWRPRYMFNTTTQPSATPGSEPNAQFERSLLMSWSDWDHGWDQGIAKTPRGQQCLAMLKAEGHPPPRDGLMGQEMIWFCDYLFLMKETLEGTRDFTQAGFAAALARLGPQSPAQTFVSHPAGRRDGAAAYRMASYDKACGCFPFTSGTTAIP